MPATTGWGLRSPASDERQRSQELGKDNFAVLSGNCHTECDGDELAYAILPALLILLLTLSLHLDYVVTLRVGINDSPSIHDDLVTNTQLGTDVGTAVLQYQGEWRNDAMLAIAGHGE